MDLLWFEHMWNNRYDLAIRQQFRADFRMTPGTFMDTFILVRNRLEKQDTRFREAFPTEKRVAIAFRSSHQPKSTGKRLYQNLFFNNVDGLTLGTLLKNEALAQVLSCEFCKVSKDTFLQNTSGRLLLCFMAFSDWEFLQQRFKNICCSKINCGKHYRLSKYFIKFPRTPSRTTKAIATFKETTNWKKFLVLSVKFRTNFS